jgi:hypothetical protein
MTHFVTLQNTDMLSSNVVGVDVCDNANHDLDTIKDVAFDASKVAKGYVLSVDGFLGMGTRYVAVDADSVKIKYRHERQEVACEYECQQGRAQERTRVQARGRMERQQVIN